MKRDKEKLGIWRARWEAKELGVRAMSIRNWDILVLWCSGTMAWVAWPRRMSLLSESIQATRNWLESVCPSSLSLLTLLSFSYLGKLSHTKKTMRFYNGSYGRIKKIKFPIPLWAAFTIQSFILTPKELQSKNCIFLRLKLIRGKAVKCQSYKS